MTSSNSTTHLQFMADESSHNAALAHDVLTGLSQARKTLPCIWFYDHRGSVLFEDITRTPEYYPTRTETRLLQGLRAEVAEVVGPGAQLVELGSGSSTKTRLLLQAMPSLAAYIPVDISKTFLSQSVAALSADFPNLVVQPVAADFTAHFELPQSPLAPQGRGGVRLGFFPGSTIGNFSPQQATELLRQFAQALGPQSWLLIGVDTTQNPALLLPAYDDARGVTAAFNLNLLSRINRELGANFQLNRFHHAARFNPAEGRIEMHLISEVHQTVQVLGHRFEFRAGESIHTENAYKYSASSFRTLAGHAGWRGRRVWSDSHGTGFAVFLMAASPQG